MEQRPSGGAGAAVWWRWSGRRVLELERERSLRVERERWEREIRELQYLEKRELGCLGTSSRARGDFETYKALKTWLKVWCIVDWWFLNGEGRGIYRWMGARKKWKGGRKNWILRIFRGIIRLWVDLSWIYSI